MPTFIKKESVKLSTILKFSLSLSLIIFLSACSSTIGKHQTKLVNSKIKNNVSYNIAGELINLSSCTSGLNGKLATSDAGKTLTSVSKTGNKKSVVQVESAFASLDHDPAPSSNKNLKLKNGLTTNLLLTAYSQTSRPYNASGTNPKTGFSPAGFTQWVYAQQGVKIDSGEETQIKTGVAVKKDDLRPGDILVYQNPKNPRKYHLGIYTGQGNFLHASEKAKVVYETAAFGPEFGPYFIGGRRFIDDPGAKSLTDKQKIAATNSAIKLALSEKAGQKLERFSQTKGTNKTTKKGKK